MGCWRAIFAQEETMKSFLACLLALCALFTLIAGTSTAFAQANLAPPTIVRPMFNSPTPGFDSGWVGSMQVYIRKTANVSRFRLVLFREGAGIAYFSKIFRQSEGATEGTGPSATIRFVLPIPAAEQGFINRLVVKSCDNNDQCGNASNSERFLVLPTAPTIAGPPHPSTLPANRTVTFSWQSVKLTLQGSTPQLPDDYQLTILTAAPEDIGWTSFNPEAVTSPNQSIRLTTGSNCPFVPGQSSLLRRCHTVTLPPGPTAFIWTFAKCVTFPEKGRRCGLSSSFRTLNAPVPITFNTHLAATFRHPRCVNCHAVAADGFQNDTANPPANNPPGGLPSNHPAVNSGPGCANCHTNALLPTQGTVNPGWHAAPATLDFRNRNDLQLCLSAQFGAGGVGGLNAALEHLTQDKLILWAVGDGRRPQSSTPLQTAPPNNIATWQSMIQSWVAAGMPCN